MTHISILGTGAMGSRMAKNLLAAGFTVTVYNRTEKHTAPLIANGATFAATPTEAVKDADVVFSMLTNDEASRSVWLDKVTGALAALKPGAIAIESSTLSVNWILTLSQECRSRNIEFLDAPVLGSRPQADEGGLIILVGGKQSTLGRIKPIVSCLSTAQFHLGDNGSGTKMKLAVNAYFAVQVSALSEIIGMLEKSTVDKSKTVELFNQLPTTSKALQGIGKLIAANNYEPLFPISLVQKDLRYLLDMTEDSDVKLPVVTATHNTYKQAISRKFSKDNIAGVVQLYL